MRLHKSLFVVGLLALILAGCESVEEQAERKYQSALGLVDASDADRALVELRGVFDLNGEHRDARMLYAQLMRERGEPSSAYSHYLLVSEQYPNDLEARVNLSELAIQLGAWDQAQRHADAAKSIDPESPALQPILASVEYQQALSQNDQALRDAAVQRARDVVSAAPESSLARQVIIDSLVRDQRFSEALEQLDAAMEVAPLDPNFNQIKLRVLAQLEDMDALGSHLKVMVERFPDNREVRTALVRWYLVGGDEDGAEAFVRELVARSGEEVPPRLALVQFLAQVRGVDAALAELDNLIEEGIDPRTFRLLRASLTFDNGDAASAIQQVEDLIGEESGSDDARDMKTTLARMLLSTGETERSQALVEEVLGEDAANVNALKLQAARLIEEDMVRDAVLALRTALDQSPRDPETITLLARAYERGGNRELMAESLALAFEASNAAPAEALRYARHLIASEKYLTAEDVLLQALRLAPQNIDLLRSLSDTYLAMNELPRAEQVVEALRQLGTDEGATLANAVQATLLQRMARTDESIQLMQTMISEGQSTLAAQTAIIRTRLANGELAEARTFMDEVLLETPPDSPQRAGVEFLNAALTATEGDFSGARAMYRGILADDPKIEPVWRALVATAVRQGAEDDAMAIVEEALVELPQSANLWWIKAGLAERSGDIDGAIGIYERLYEEDSTSTIIANNLASMITTYRRDDESLQRAYVIARRLRGTEVPAFQDTYGWIAYRLGDYEEALDYLEPAAAGLPNDPAVQYHLARVYLALNRSDDAEARLEKSVELWGDSELDLAGQARAALAELTAPASDPTE